MKIEYETKTKRQYMIEIINRIKVSEPQEKVTVPEELKGFGTIIHDNEKCVSCGACTLECEDDAIHLLRHFDLNSLQALSDKRELQNRKLLADFIEKLKVKEPTNPIKVPEGLLGFGTIEVDLVKCIFCEECYKICQFEAIEKEMVWDLPEIIKNYKEKYQ